MSYHAKQYHGGAAIYVQVDNGKIILIQNGVAALFDTPYRNKYGELADKKSETWNSFKLDIEYLNNIKKTYEEFKLQDMIV